MTNNFLAFAAGTVLSVVCAASTAADLLQVGELKVQAVSGTVSKISGTAKNLTSSAIDYASIVFNLFDDENALVGNTAVVAAGIEPGGVWKFEATATTPFTYVKVGDVKGTLKTGK